MYYVCMSVWLCMATFSYVWLYMAMYGYVCIDFLAPQYWHGMWESTLLACHRVSLLSSLPPAISAQFEEAAPLFCLRSLSRFDPLLRHIIDFELPFSQRQGSEFLLGRLIL